MTVIIAVWATKGGAGKSTLTLNCAIEAGRAGLDPVLVVDADAPQHSLVQIRDRRPGSAPRIVRADGSADLEAKVARARELGYAVVMIDTPPGAGPVGPAAAAIADFVLIPSRPTPWDLSATNTTLGQVRRLRRRHGLVIVGAPPRREGRDAPEVAATRRALQPEGARLWGGQLSHRAAWWRAAACGQGVSEYEPGGSAARESESLWKATWKMLPSQEPGALRNAPPEKA